MVRRFVHWLALLLISAPASLALEGRLIDARDGLPVAHAEVGIVGRTPSARSDSDGRFVLVPDPRPPFELLVTLPDGRLLPPIPVERLPGEGPLIVEVIEAMSESVTVTAGITPGIPSAPASGTTVVSRAETEMNVPRNLTQTLEDVPGVSSVSEGHAAIPAIRGLAQARTLLLIDGARVTAERRAGPSATFLDPFIVESIQVSRGPGSLAYGSDAFGGVILAETRQPRPGSEPRGAIAGTLGTGIPQQRLGVELETGLDARSALLVSVHHRRFGDYDSPDGRVVNSGSRDGGWLARYVRVTGRGVFNVALQRDEGREIERPRTNSDVVRFYYPEETSTRWTGSFKSEGILGLDSEELSWFLGEHRIVTDQDRYATSTAPRAIERSVVAARDFGLRATGTEHVGQARLEFGLDLHGRLDLQSEDVAVSFDDAGNRVDVARSRTIEDARRIDAGLFALVEGAPIPEVTLAGGARVDRIETENTGGYFGSVSDGRTEGSGFVAVTFGPFAGLSATAQYARGFRDARLSDRFFRGVTGAGFITGNPDLDAESSDQFDVAFRLRRGPWRTALYLYDYRIEDLIERFEDPAQPDNFFFRNRGRVRIRGVELEAQAELPAGIELRGTASIASGEALEDGGAVDDIQPDAVSLALRKTFGERVFLRVRGARLGPLDDPGPTEVVVDGYTVFDATVGWRVSPAVELQLQVRNLFDERYALSSDRRSPLAPGRSAVVTTRARF